ncbi:hypothetical protein AX16_009875 [Volvariella volvacea WC 439]|nr:hypothetical protein AX16_009875 [Volvariella volvacea WC 439]
MSVIQGGVTYRIVNAQAGTAIDLSAGDDRSVIGWTPHDGANQRWTLEWTGRSWFFRSAATGQFLALDGSPNDGTRLIASENPQEWHIWQDQYDTSSYRIFVPYTYYNIDLSGWGNATPGTPIQLWWTWKGGHQTWRFEPQS